MSRAFSDLLIDLKADGSLRDFYIQDASPDDWDCLLAHIPKLARSISFSHGGNDMPLPTSFHEIADLQASDPTTMRLGIAGGTLCCHFFSPDEVEFDFIPQDFHTEESWNDLMHFFRSIVAVLGKRGIISHENSPSQLIDVIEP